jgi:glycosyltransferase involved in cell wall biosynthesis
MSTAPEEMMTIHLKMIQEVQINLMNNDKKIKVLLCLNGDKDPNKPLIDRGAVLLRYALEAVDVEYTYDYLSNFNIVQLLSINQLKAYQGLPHHKFLNKKAPVVISLFNDDNDIKGTDIDQDSEDYQTALLKAYKPIVSSVDDVLCSWTSEAIILKHLNLFKTVNLVNIGAKQYQRGNYSPIELGAFRKYYSVEKDAKIILCYGEYVLSKGLDILQSVCRMLPEYEFFFFGGKSGVLSDSKRFEKTNTIPNLHFEGHLPEELYHSAVLSAYAAFIPYKFHSDSVFLLELMKAGVPIVSSYNPFLYDFLINNQTACLGESVEDFFHILKNIGKENFASGAKLFAEKYTPEGYGQRLKEVYTRLLI